MLDLGKLKQDLYKILSRNAPIWSVSCGPVAAALTMADQHI